jgi:uncharacterized protein (TIGR03437 family)
MGIKEAISLSSASYATLPTVFNPTCGTATNACNALTVVAPDDLVAAFGADLANITQLDGTFPLTLGGTSMTLVDSTNTTFPVPMYFVAPQQVNYYVPTSAAPGPATITVISGDGTESTGFLLILPEMPALYTQNQNGQGVAAAIAICSGVCANWPNPLPTGQFYQNVFSLSGGSYMPQPISLASTDTVVVEFFGTGLRHLSSQSVLTAQVMVNGAEQSVPVLYVGAQGEFTGLDQVNLQIPSNLTGSGEVSVVLTVQDPVNNVNATANSVSISIQ